MASKFRDQRVELYLYLPKGTVFVADETVQHFDESDNNFFNLHHSSDEYLYKVDENQVNCLNCPAEENEYNDVKTEDISIEENDTIKTVSVKVNGKEVINTKSGKKGKLTIGSDGIIIKTE
jgi:hypothetical protein